MKEVLRYCIPTVFALAINGLYAIMDGLFIGQSAGDAGLTAINMAWPIPALIIATGLGLGLGGSIVFARYLGQGARMTSIKVLKTLLIALLIIGIALSLIIGFIFPWILQAFGATGEVYQHAHSYLQITVFGIIFQISGPALLPILRNLGLPIHAMIASCTGMIINLGLNYLFVLVLDMDLAGAALGTVIGQAGVVLLCVLFIILNREKIKSHFNLATESTSAANATDESESAATTNNNSESASTTNNDSESEANTTDKSCAPITMPSAAKIFHEILLSAITPFGVSLAPSVILVLSNYTSLRYGGTAGVASYTVVSYVTFPVQNMLQGVGDGLQPLITLYHGSNRKESLDRILASGRKLSILLAILLTILSWVSMEFIATAYGISSVAKDYFIIGLRINTIAFIFIALLKLHISYHNATGNHRRSTIFTFAECLFVAPLFIFLLSSLWGMDGLWISYAATNILLFGASFLLK